MNNMRSCIFFEIIGDIGGMKLYNHSFINSLSKVYKDVDAVVPTEVSFNDNVSIHNNFVIKSAGSRIRKLFVLLLMFLKIRHIVRHQNNVDIFAHVFHQNIFEIVKVGFLSLYADRLYIIYHDINDLRSRRKSLFKTLYTWLLNRVCAARSAKLFTHSYHYSGLNLPYTQMILERLPHVDVDHKVANTVEKYTVLYFGNFVKHTEFEATITALESFAENNPDCNICVAGRLSQIQHQALTSRMNHMRLPNFVVDNRFIPDTELNLLLSSSKYVVIPYKKVFSSGVLLRAISNGCIPLCYRNSEFDAIPCIARLIYNEHDELENLIAKVSTFTPEILSEIKAEFKLFLLENSENSLIQALREKLKEHADEK